VRTALVDKLMALGRPGMQQGIVQRMRDVEAAGAMHEPAEVARLFVWLAAACERRGILSASTIRLSAPKSRRSPADFVIDKNLDGVPDMVGAPASSSRGWSGGAGASET
jgi:hypothetical protein